MNLTIVVVLAAALGGPLRGEPPAQNTINPDLNEARRTGWQVALTVTEKLRSDDKKNFPGIQSWLADFDKVAKGIDVNIAPDQWPAIDVDALTIRNPSFWPAYFEVAPGDSGLMLLHAGLLLSAGEAVRASHVCVVAGQRSGIPKEIQQGLEIILVQTQKVPNRPNALVFEGIKLHDKADYAGALKKYREAIALWPQNGFAHFEQGLTLYHQQLIAAGEKPPMQDSIKVNGSGKFSADVVAAYAKARQHDPFQVKAYQGDNKEVIRGLLALVRKGLPAWQKLVTNRQEQVSNEVLEELAAACQEANIHELALVTRQMLVARRNGYAPADHPFISTSLRKLAPGPQSEALLERLAGGELKLRQLVVPEPG